MGAIKSRIGPFKGRDRASPEPSIASDADSFLEQLEKLNADKETKEKIRKEIMRFI